MLFSETTLKTLAVIEWFVKFRKDPNIKLKFQLTSAQYIFLNSNHFTPTKNN